MYMDIIKTKPIEAYDNNLKKVFELIAFKKKVPTIMGSNASKFEYTTDYDLFEVIDTNTNFNTLKIDVANGFVEIMRNFKNNDKFYFIEFLCGIDNEKNSLKWKVDDILNGFVMVNNKRYSLYDVLNERSIMKLEMVLYKDNYFVPISNVYEFRINGKGINQEKETRDDINSLKSDVRKYIDKKDYMKVLRRIYLIVKQLPKETKLTDTIVSIFQSYLGKLNKVKGDLETMADVLDAGYNDKTTLSRIKTELQKLKEYSSNVPIEWNQHYFSDFDKLNGADHKQMLDGLHMIINKLNKIIQTLAKSTISKHKININKFT